MNLFCSAEHMADRQAAHAAEQGRIRTLAELRELGIAEWGPLMHEQCCGQQEQQTVEQTMRRDARHLFDVELRFQDAMEPMIQPDGAGELVGSGVGEINGPRLHGRLRWSNFERSHPDYCQLSLSGEIETDDGATFQFDSRGFALLQGDKTWRIVAAVRFVVDDARYQWLQAVPTVWTGEFDEATGTARYRAYALEPLESDTGQNFRMPASLTRALVNRDERGLFKVVLTA